MLTARPPPLSGRGGSGRSPARWVSRSVQDSGPVRDYTITFERKPSSSEEGCRRFLIDLSRVLDLDVAEHQEAMELERPKIAVPASDESAAIQAVARAADQVRASWRSLYSLESSRR